MTTITWWPALFEGKTLIHGDSVFVGVVPAKMHAEILAGLRPLSWARDIYGGHPFFAESPGGFFNPLNVFFAAAVSPLFGYLTSVNWLHWTYMVIASVGFVGLARTLGLSKWAQVVGGIGAIFSSLWVLSEPNSAFAATMATVPWALWAFEVWLRRPTIRKALLFGAACAWMFVAGYPHIAYGTVLYMAISLAPGFFQRAVRVNWLQSWRAYVATGLAAILLCVGLAAVQLAPLMELSGYSYRHAGTQLIHISPSPTMQIRGALFWEAWDLASTQFPMVGSILICILASLAPLLARQARVYGHFAAVFVLLNLGFGYASPLFKWIYDSNLLPGLHAFRIMHPFHLVSAIGIGLLAGCCTDALARSETAETRSAALRTMARKPWLWLSLLVIAFWAMLAMRYNVDGMPHLGLWLALAAGAGATALFASDRAVWIAPLIAGLMCVDAASERLQPYRFFDTALFSPPLETSLIESQPNWRDYKHAHFTLAEVFGFTPQTDPALLEKFQRVRHGVLASINVLWDVRSLHGAYALPLARRRMLDSVLTEESFGRSQTPPGLRLIDILSVRFLSFDTRVDAPGYRVLEHNEAQNLWLMENTAARPRFQFYARHIEVHSPEVALPILTHLSEPLLVVETPAHHLSLPQVDAGANVGARYQLLKDRGDRYLLAVHAERPVWLFLADANYPGWRATIDGAPAPIYSAQILGKAVMMPAGDHILALAFRSDTLRWGAWVTGLTAMLALGGLLFLQQRRRRLSTLS